MRSLAVPVLAFAVVTLNATLATAQTTPQPGARAAEDATKAAKAVLVRLEERHASGIGGTVQLRPIGNKTEVLVSLNSAMRGQPVVTLRRGRDCQDGRYATAADIALAPMNSAGYNAPISRTIINLPIEKIRGTDYVVDVRNATQRAEFAQACASLRR